MDGRRRVQRYQSVELIMILQLILGFFIDWLEEDEPEKFKCRYCQKSYSGSRTEFKKHAASQKHIKIAEIFKAGLSRKDIPRQNVSTDYQKKFRMAWLEEKNFKIWLLPVVGAPDKFECSFCDKE